LRRPDRGFWFERSARIDPRVWGLLLVGAILWYAGATVDPLANCNEAGECAPWLVPVAYVIGVLFAAAGLGLLYANPRRGHVLDPASGELSWWQKRMGSRPGDEGRIHVSRIGCIAIDHSGDDQAQVHLYDLDGNRQPFFDGEVIPAPYESWARDLQWQWPHIRIDVRD